MDSLLGALARKQDGLFRLEDAERIGLSKKEVHRRVSDATLLERQPGVFQAASSPFPIVVQERAALLSAGETAMLSHDNAAKYWHLGTPEPTGVWITMPQSERPPKLWGVDLMRSRHTAPFRRVVDGRPMTSPARTWVDLGRTRRRDELEAALANGMQRQLFTLDDVGEVMAVAHNRAGTGLVRQVLPFFNPQWESALSALFARITIAAGIGLTPGYRIVDDSGRTVAVLDFADEVLKIAFEVDGWYYHGSKLQQQSDKSRDRKLFARYGWVTFRFTTDDLMNRADAVVAEVLAILATARAA